MMDYLVINSNMHRSPAGGHCARKVESASGKASRCGAMNKNANSTGTDPRAYHSIAKNDEEKGISVPEKNLNDEEELVEKTVTTCGMAGNVQKYFIEPRPMSTGYMARDGRSHKVTDLPHLMKVLTVCGQYFPGETAAKLRYEAAALAEMMRGNDTKMAVLPMNWGSFLSIPLDWIDVRLSEETRKVKLRDANAEVLDLTFSRIFTQCEPGGFNKEFFEEFTSCVGWQTPSNEKEAFAMLLAFCAMTRAIMTSEAAEELQEGNDTPKEDRTEVYEELKRILWLPTVKTEWLEMHFQNVLAELHSTAAWAMTVHLIGQLEEVEISNPRDQIIAISKAFQQQILANDVISSPSPTVMTARYNGVSKRVGGFNPYCMDGKEAARMGGFLSRSSSPSSPDPFASRASSPASFGDFEEGEVEALLSTEPEQVRTKDVAEPQAVPIAQEGEQDRAVENLRKSSPQPEQATAQATANVPSAQEGEQEWAVENLQQSTPQPEQIAKTAAKQAVEYPADSAAFFATMTAPTAEAMGEIEIEDRSNPMALTEAALQELEIVVQCYVENRSVKGAEDNIQKRAMEEGPRLVLEGLLTLVLETEEDMEVAKGRAAAHAFVLECWSAADVNWCNKVDVLVRSPDRRYNVLTLLMEIQNTWPYMGSREWREEGEAQLLEIGDLRHRRRQWLGIMINSGSMMEGADADFARMIWNRCRTVENAVVHGKKKLLPFFTSTLSASKVGLISDLIPAFEKDIIARKARLSDVLVFAASMSVGPEAPITSPAAQKALFLRKEGGTLTYSGGSTEAGSRPKRVATFTPAVKLSQGQRKRLRYQRRAEAKISRRAQARADLQFLDAEARKAGWRSKKEKRLAGDTAGATPATPPRSSRAGLRVTTGCTAVGNGREAAGNFDGGADGRSRGSAGISGEEAKVQDGKEGDRDGAGNADGGADQGQLWARGRGSVLDAGDRVPAGEQGNGSGRKEHPRADPRRHRTAGSKLTTGYQGQRQMEAGYGHAGRNASG